MLKDRLRQADARVIQSTALQVAVAALTGESIPVVEFRTRQMHQSRASPLLDEKLLNARDLRIVSSNVEAGYYTEANVVKVMDGERTVRYVPARIEDKLKQ